MKTKQHRCGTPSIDEWRGPWKSTPSDSDVTDQEYSKACVRFDESLSTIGKIGFGEGYDFYLRGDNFGDRTQYLEIINPRILTIPKLLGIQRILRLPQNSQWRFYIPTDLGDHSGIMVYAQAISIGNPTHELTSGELASIVDLMIESRTEEGENE